MLKEYIPYGAGNFVLFKPKNMSAIKLQQELLTGYSIFYNYSQILKKAGDIFKKGLRPIGFNFMGCRLIKKSRQGIRRHMEWIKTMN